MRRPRCKRPRQSLQPGADHDDDGLSDASRFKEQARGSDEFYMPLHRWLYIQPASRELIFRNLLVGITEGVHLSAIDLLMRDTDRACGGGFLASQKQECGDYTLSTALACAHSKVDWSCQRIRACRQAGRQAGRQSR